MGLVKLTIKNNKYLEVTFISQKQIVSPLLLYSPYWSFKEIQHQYLEESYKHILRIV